MRKELAAYLEQIAPELKWSKVKEISNFPFDDYSDLKKKVKDNHYTIGIDYSVSNKFAEWLYGSSYRYFFLLLASTPILIAILSLILSIALKNYWLLFGIILGIAGQVFSNPYNPSKFFRYLANILFLVFLYALWQEKQTLTWITAFFVFPFFINNFIYKHNQDKLKEEALKSEKLLIYLYQSGKLGFKDNSNEQTYWHLSKEN